MQNRPRRSYRRQPNARTRHDRFEPVIRAASDSAILADPTLGGQLVIEREGRLTVSYAPFEHIQRGARIVIVGITPGAQQAGNAPRELRRQLLAGADHSTALAAAKVYASFSGAMRPNLVGMLDHIGVARWLGIRSTDSLWSADRNQVHFTSAFRYPVFYDGANNFNGQVAARRSKALTRVLNTCLAEEAAALPDALWIPLGESAAPGVQYMVSKGLLKPGNVLSGMLHPSPATMERIQYFLGTLAKPKPSPKTNAADIDALRAGLIAKVAALPAA